MLKKKVVEIFEYKTNNNSYKDGAKLYQQVVNKALSIIKALYPKYLLLFLLIIQQVILFT